MARLAARPRGRTPTRRPTSWVLVGSFASGVAAYAFQVLGTRALDAAAYAPIAVLWTIQYLLFTTVLYAGEAYVTRTVALHGDDAGAITHAGRTLAAWLTVAAVLVGGGTWVARGPLFGGVGHFAGVAAAIVLAFGAFTWIRGRLAGTSRFRSYGAATALESVGRTAIAAAAMAVRRSNALLAWVMPLGALMVAVWWLWERRGVQPPATASDVAVEPVVEGSGRFLVSTTVANGVNQALLAAGPLLLVALGASAREVSVFTVTVTAARTPLAFAYGGLLSRVLPPLTRLARSGDERALRRVVGLTACATVALAVLAGVVAGPLGPPIVAFFFGASFRPGALFAALTGVGVVLGTGALVLNQTLIAREAETRLVPAWLAGLVAALVTVAATSASPTLRASAGFVVGEFVALVALLIASTTIRRPPAAP